MIIRYCKVCGIAVECSEGASGVICDVCTTKRASSLETTLERLRKELRRLEDRGAKNCSKSHKISKEILELDKKLKGLGSTGQQVEEA